MLHLLLLQTLDHYCFLLGSLRRAPVKLALEQAVHLPLVVLLPPSLLCCRVREPIDRL